MKPTLEALLGMFRDRNTGGDNRRSYEETAAYDRSHSALAPLLVKSVEALKKCNGCDTYTSERGVHGMHSDSCRKCAAVAEIEAALAQGTEARG